ncbi:GspH/FimT family pseudopilin [Nitrincola alkalilacustris]|uniref:GspH/FimT family pseudopilin n=1 Tax=Nitrincola alkalilacustris TaxID=1571224 RepID=UPI00124E8196|nr:GspH/FimT family pseudopilin [Nitrincola alkalilacustris]
MIKHPQAGLTLVELMVTVSVLAVLLGVAAPSFVSTVQNSRATTLANAIVYAFNLARSEAVRRGDDITVCPSLNEETCSGNDWTVGWIVLAPDGTVIRSWSSPQIGAVISLAQADVVFNGLGGLTGDAITFDAYYEGCKGDKARAVDIRVTGRISVGRIDCGS